jgi:hypothetical protein
MIRQANQKAAMNRKIFRMQAALDGATPSMLGRSILITARGTVAQVLDVSGSLKKIVVRV